MRLKTLRWKAHSKGFTLLELTLVILLIAVIAVLAIGRGVGLSYWREEGFIRSLNETIIFLHHQATVDRAYYRLEIDLDHNRYQIGVLKSEDADLELQQFSQDLGVLSLELAAYLNPSIGSTYSFIPPPSYPSLAEPVTPPAGVIFQDVRTMRGREFDAKPYILFSPRSFSEFAVIHMELSDLTKVSILINPFTGNTEIFRGSEYKDFEWAYGRNSKTG